MKTSRFEENLRKKLESIEPDFQEADWLKMQAYMPVKPTPSFWQSHGQWLGYTAAAASTVVMGLLYINQSRQTEALLSEVSSLKTTIEQQQVASKKTDNKTDTIYIFKDYPVRELNRSSLPDNATISGEYAHTTNQKDFENQPITSNNQDITNTSTASKVNQTAEQPTDNTQAVAEKPRYSETAGPGRDGASSVPPGGTIPENAVTQLNSSPENTISELSTRIDWNTIETLETPKLEINNAYLNRILVHRIPKANAKHYQAPTPDPAKPTEKQLAKSSTAAQPSSPAEATRILPVLPPTIPYRVGIGQQWESQSKSTTLWYEMLFGRHFALNTGISWVKLDDQKFQNDIAFWDKTRINFRKYNGGKVPSAFSVYNISMRTTALQLPVNFLYRSNPSGDLSLFVGIGTNVNLNTKQTIDCDVLIPNGRFEQHSQKGLLDIPAFNNASFSLGIEKRWNPIAVQVDSYLSLYSRSRPIFQDSRNLGLRVKVLYAFGGNKK